MFVAAAQRFGFRTEADDDAHSRTGLMASVSLKTFKCSINVAVITMRMQMTLPQELLPHYRIQSFRYYNRCLDEMLIPLRVALSTGCSVPAGARCMR